MKKDLKKYAELIESYAKGSYRQCFREPQGKFEYPCFVPGAFYSSQLWDWDSWLTDIALAKMSEGDDILPYEEGCVLNFLDAADDEGRIPINIVADGESIFDLKPGTKVNIHKPCLAQHALFVSKRANDGAEWLREKFPVLERFLAWYKKNCFHEETGLYVWVNDFAIGVDNDPCVFYRPGKSTAAIFLNCLMYGELSATAELCTLLGNENAAKYAAEAEELKHAIMRECWDDKDGFYYSADVLLEKVDPDKWLHSGAPRHWRSIPMRIGVWAGFLTMYYGIATKEQARRMVEEHYRNEKEFFAPYGVRSLSKAETRMYVIRGSGNPSCWLGPIWGNCNYMVYEGLLRYGYRDDAVLLAEKTVRLFGQDVERCGEFHEYYHPETGEGVLNQGFQSWNLLAYNLAEDLKNGDFDRTPDKEEV